MPAPLPSMVSVLLLRGVCSKSNCSFVDSFSLIFCKWCTYFRRKGEEKTTTGSGRGRGSWQHLLPLPRRVSVSPLSSTLKTDTKFMRCAAAAAISVNGRRWCCIPSKALRFIKSPDSSKSVHFWKNLHSTFIMYFFTQFQILQSDFNNSESKKI